MGAARVLQNLSNSFSLSLAMSSQSDNGVKTVETNQENWAYYIHASRKCILVCVLGLIWCLSWAYTPQFERPGVSPSLERLAGHCKNVSPISKEEYLTRQTDLATVLASLGGTAYIAEPGANSQFFGNFSNSHWHLSERPLLLMISPVSSDALGGSIIPQVIILTPKVSTLPIPITYLFECIDKNCVSKF